MIDYKIHATRLIEEYTYIIVLLQNGDDKMSNIDLLSVVKY